MARRRRKLTKRSQFIGRDVYGRFLPRRYRAVLRNPAGKIPKLLILGILGIGVYYLWQRSKAAQAAETAAGATKLLAQARQPLFELTKPQFVISKDTSGGGVLGYYQTSREYD